jgi:hypothetical protein
LEHRKLVALVAKNDLHPVHRAGALGFCSIRLVSVLVFFDYRTIKF